MNVKFFGTSIRSMSDNIFLRGNKAQFEAVRNRFDNE
jgi:hypothetical protein